MRNLALTAGRPVPVEEVSPVWADVPPPQMTRDAAAAGGGAGGAARHDGPEVLRTLHR